MESGEPDLRGRSAHIPVVFASPTACRPISLRSPDATDVALSITFGACTLASFTVITEEIAG